MNQATRLLRLEGGAALAAAALAYSAQGWNKWWFMLLLLVPDISMIGYLANAKSGALIYNLGHTYVSPALLGLLGLLNHSDILLQGSLIWLAHIGFDRLLGYGLKSPEGFAQTHLGTIISQKNKRGSFKVE